MNDEKIFSDLLGILKWIEFNRGNDSKPGVNGSKPTIEEGIKEVISFLDIEERDEEVEALKEYLFDKNSNNEFDIQDFYKIFVKDAREKRKEYNNILQAFNSLKKNETDDFIYMDDFNDSIKSHENKYTKSFDIIKTEIEGSDFLEGDDKFYYKKYLEKLYNIKPDMKEAEVDPEKINENDAE